MADRILGIETSCDETAAAVVERASRVRSSVVASQIDQHARYGGVVPEIASRAHVEMLTPVVAQALVEAGVADDEIDAVAATTGPGLVGSLLVGVSAAKALALVWGVPFVAVNHLEGHLYASFLEHTDHCFGQVVDAIDEVGALDGCVERDLCRGGVPVRACQPAGRVGGRGRQGHGRLGLRVGCGLRRRIRCGALVHQVLAHEL